MDYTLLEVQYLASGSGQYKAAGSELGVFVLPIVSTSASVEVDVAVRSSAVAWIAGALAPG
jgi:hypothetical protein